MQNLDHVVEEEPLTTEFNNRSKSLPRTYLDKHDLYASQLTDKKLKSPKSVQNLPTTSAYTPNSMNAVNYNDYYNSLTAQYPMPMAEMQKKKPEGINVDHYLNNAMTTGTYTSSNPKNPFLNNMTTSHKTDSIQSLNKAIGDLSPVFQSEAARQIITEMSGNSSEENTKKNPLASKQRRAIPREKRRHYTAPSNTLGTKSTKYIQSENDMNKNVIYSVFDARMFDETVNFVSVSIVEYQLACQRRFGYGSGTSTTSECTGCCTIRFGSMRENIRKFDWQAIRCTE